MDKLDLRHVCAMLPHGVKFISELDKPYDEFGQNPIWTLNGISEMFGEYCLLTKENNDAYPISKCKLLLLPLSALTESMEDGTVPIVELAKISGLKSSEYTTEEQDGTLVVFGKEIRYPGSNNAAKFFFELETDNCDMDKGIEFLDPSSYDFSPLNNQLQLFEYLYSKHFDIYGLIPLELAKDKRKPYEL